MTALVTFVAVVVLVLAHIFTGSLRFLSGIPRSRWLSFASGVSVAYVFVHILPDLSAGQTTLEQAGWLGASFNQLNQLLLADITPFLVLDWNKAFSGRGGGMAKVIELISVSKSYASANAAPVPAVTNINLDIAAGQMVTLLGANGAGKTTLLKLIAGLLPADSGQVKLFGRSVAHPRDQALSQTRATLPCGLPLSNELSVDDNLRTCTGLEPPAQALVQELGLEAYRTKPLGELSSGWQRRVLLVCTLSAAAPILLVDEPTLGLDESAAGIVKTQLKRLSREWGKTVVVATCSVELAQELSDRIVIMRQGSVAADMPVSRMLNLFRPVYYQIRVRGRLDQPWAAWFAGLTLNSEPGETVLTGPVADQAALHGLLIKIRDLGLPLVSLKRIEPDVEDVLARFLA